MCFGFAVSCIGCVGVRGLLGTNAAVGSLYSVKDLLKVTLAGGDLATFLYNFDSMNAGRRES